MSILKFKTFEELEELERKGKGINLEDLLFLTGKKEYLEKNKKG